ncbi:hypothetical protein GGF46_001778 [Coemansia sp. RSA 552]|nr:hypothetical protein GGF46_001778 [Coemansia sp. RSA 552]
MDLPAEFSRVLSCQPANATPETTYSDKVFLPQSFLSSLLDRRNRAPPGGSGAARSARRQQQPLQHSDDFDASSIGDADQLPSPLIFRLVRRGAVAPGGSKHTPVFCGVREFSADEGCVAIPQWLMGEAGLERGDSVAVEFVRPEKGTFARLQALDSSARTVGDLRSLLETHMRSRLTVLAAGQTFLVPVGGMDQPLSFSVAALEPMQAIDVVDTDLSVDIVYADGGVISSHLDGDHEGGKVEELVPGVALDITTVKDCPRVVQLHIPAQVRVTEVLATCKSGGDASLFASRLLRSPDAINNTWADYSPPSQQPKKLRIKQTELPSGSNNVYIAVAAFTETCHVSIEARLDTQLETGTLDLSPPTADEGEEVVPEGKQCPNCGSVVPDARFDMHRAVCERHNVKCPKCPRVFKRGSAELEQHWHCALCDETGEAADREKHDYFYHTPRVCACSPHKQFGSMVELAEHRRMECPERLIECQYCHTIVAQGAGPTSTEAIMVGQHEHEWICGSRSIECAKCKSYVRIRQAQVHMRLHKMKEQTARANMKPCANRECTRERGANPLGLCAICFGPFYTSQYDPGHQKLLRRLARSLHAQMTGGCGKATCRNVHCASGRASVKAGAPLTQTEAAAMLVPVLKAYAPLAASAQAPGTIDFTSIDLHLCV